MVAERKDDLLGGRGEVGCLAWVVSQLRRDKGGREVGRARGESFACERQRDRTRVFCLALLEPLVLFFLMERDFYYHKCKYEPLTKSLLVTSAP